MSPGWCPSVCEPGGGGREELKNATPLHLCPVNIAHAYDRAHALKDNHLHDFFPCFQNSVYNSRTGWGFQVLCRSWLIPAGWFLLWPAASAFFPCYNFKRLVPANIRSLYICSVRSTENWNYFCIKQQIYTMFNISPVRDDDEMEMYWELIHPSIV